MLDRTYRNHIKNSKLLNDNTKTLYLSKLNVIQNDIWNNCKSKTKVGKGKCLHYIINHPEAFTEKMEEYVNKTQGRIDKNKLSVHSKDSYVSVICALFRHSPGMIQKYTDLYKKWMDIHNNIRAPINAKYQSNMPNKRQENGYVPFDEVIKKRNSLDIGSNERLLLAMYTMIPPVRSDYDKVSIYYHDKSVNNDNENYLVMGNAPYIVLNKYKTSKTYKDNKIVLPKELIKEIKESLKKNKREYLFVSSRNNKPYEKSNSFNKWANRVLKNLFNKDFSLKLLRNIYITRRDLKLEEKSGLERNKIAKIMGHSVSTQQNYLWHTYEKEKLKK
jgi:hypothetical protein